MTTPTKDFRRRRGLGLDPRRFRLTPLQRWCEKVTLPTDPNGCWPWMAKDDGKGYGVIGVGHRQLRAARFGYETFIGPIPWGLTLDHLCRNRACVNPAHLEAVTNRENVLRGEGLTAQLARLTHCKRGHPFSGDNLRVKQRTDGRTYRMCATCLRINWEAENERRRQRALGAI